MNLIVANLGLKSLKSPNVYTNAITTCVGKGSSPDRFCSLFPSLPGRVLPAPPRGVPGIFLKLFCFNFFFEKNAI